MLRGYKEIANWIEKATGIALSVWDTCRYSQWAVDPLPVIKPFRQIGSRGPVYANSDAVEAWVRRRMVYPRNSKTCKT
jgi:hypothetical protein